MAQSNCAGVGFSGEAIAWRRGAMPQWDALLGEPLREGRDPRQTIERQ